MLLADVVASAVEAGRPLIEAGRHELTVQLPAEPVFLDADLIRLAQVFANLLTNGAKYTEPGGHIWLTAERTGMTVIVVVRDTGIGIPAAALPRIFDMFSQVDRSIERVHRRPRHRPGARQGPRRDARRHRPGGKFRRRPGEHVHRALPALGQPAAAAPRA